MSTRQAGYFGPQLAEVPLVLRQNFDLLFFARDTQRARPTAEALRKYGSGGSCAAVRPP